MTTMRQIVPLLLLLSLALTNNALADVASAKPEKPQAGDRIEFTYDQSAPGAVLKDQEDINLEVLIMNERGQPVLIEQPMARSGSILTTTVDLSDTAVALVFRFASGESTDEHNGSSWDLLVYGNDGIPVESALREYALSLYKSTYFGFSRPADFERALQAIDRDLSLYPHEGAETNRWVILKEGPDQEESFQIIKEELDASYEAKRIDAYVAFAWYQTLNQSERAAQVRAECLKDTPTGEAAQNLRWNDIAEERDPVRRLQLSDSLRRDFPPEEKYRRESDIRHLRYLLSAREFDRAVALIDSIQNPPGDLLNQMAWTLAESDLHPEIRLELARRGVDAYQNAQPSDKPSYMTIRRWERNQGYGMGMVADTYGFCLEKAGRTEEAEQAYAQAHTAFHGEEVEISERYVGCCIRNGNYQKAIEVSRDCVKNGYSSDTLVDLYQEAFLHMGGSEEQFTAELRAGRETALMKTRREMLENLVDEPAVDFTLVDLATGENATLSRLKGKVVVVDFWATWCGPCLQSFPYLQKVVDHYAGNDNVVILTLNTWERKNGAARTAHVKKFMQENKYTFRVLLDEKTIDAYKVEGIPTKFIIDRNGKVQFKSIGFEGGQKMMDEMILQIDMLLSNEFYSAR